MSRKRDIHGQDKEKEGQASSLKSRALLFVRIAKAQCYRIWFVKNADFIKAKKFYENFLGSPA